MSDLTKNDVLKLAQLARLSLSQDEVILFQKEISSILDYVKQLENIETSGLEPTSQVTGLTNVMREDVIKDYGISRTELLKNLPDSKDGMIKVKRMLG